MPNKISLARARALLAQAVALRGRDFVYLRQSAPFSSACFYQPVTDQLLLDQGYVYVVDEARVLPDDDPRRSHSCIAGFTLELGGEFRQREHEGEAVSSFDGSSELGGPTLLTPRAAQYLRRAQSVQDSGGTAGLAYDNAETFANSPFSKDYPDV